MRCKVTANHDCAPCGDGSIKLYVKDDFKLIYSFTDHRYNPTLIIPPDHIEFEFKYTILGRPDTEFIASHLNGEYKNCFQNDSTNELVVLFDNHNLKAGQLVVEYHFSVHDEAFPEKVADRYNSELTGIVLTDNLLELEL